MTPARRSDRTTQVGALLLLVALVLAAPARAVEEDLDYGKVYAIQPREFRMNQEFSVGLAFLPLDAFYKFFAGSFHYVLHFTDLLAWENHFAFCKYLDVDTGLQGDLNSKWDATATDTPKIEYFFDTNLMFKPLYGKMALFDRWVIFSETYFLIGIGAEKFQTAWNPSIDVGVGMRIFLSDTLSLRFEAREYVYISDAGADSTLYLGIVFSYNAFAEERQLEIARVKAEEKAEAKIEGKTEVKP